VIIEHCYREANWVVDRLANFGIDQNSSVVFFDSPRDFVKLVLWEDTVNLCWLSIVCNC